MFYYPKILNLESFGKVQSVHSHCKCEAPNSTLNSCHSSWVSQALHINPPGGPETYQHPLLP